MQVKASERTIALEKGVQCLKYNKNPPAQNMCSTGFDHGFKKQQMVDEYASGKYGNEYGTGYKAGREYAFKQTGSRRKTKKMRKTRRVKKVNGRK